MQDPADIPIAEDVAERNLDAATRANADPYYKNYGLKKPTSRKGKVWSFILLLIVLIIVILLIFAALRK
jgi:uncharacterized membrane protein